MGMSVMREIGSLIWHHPYVSCALLVLFTPPFFPILKYFSPLLISTALFIVALVTMGPHFEGTSEQEVELRRDAEVKIWEDMKVQEEDSERLSKRQKSGKDQSTWSNWVKNYHQTGLAWVEHKFKNENWRGAALNDENVSILQEAFPHRGEEKAMVVAEKSPEKRPPFEAFPSRDPPRDLAVSEARELPHSVSDRSFERRAPFSLVTDKRDLPHDFFLSYPSFDRRPELEIPSFKSVMPPPIKYDMPAQLTGPAEIDGTSMDSDDDFDSDDELDHHECHHDEDFYPEVGETALVPFSAFHEEQPALVEGAEQSPAVSYEIYDKNFFPPADIHEGRSVPPTEGQDERHLRPPIHDMQSLPPNELNKEPSYPSEHEEIPDLEEVAPFASGFYEPLAAAEGFFPSSDEIHHEMAREDEHSTGRRHPNMAETSTEHAAAEGFSPSSNENHEMAREDEHSTGRRGFVPSSNEIHHEMAREDEHSTGRGGLVPSSNEIHHEMASEDEHSTGRGGLVLSSNEIHHEMAREDEHSTERRHPNMAETFTEHAAVGGFFPSSYEIHHEMAREDEHSTGRRHPNMAETVTEHAAGEGFFPSSNEIHHEMAREDEHSTGPNMAETFTEHAIHTQEPHAAPDSEHFEAVHRTVPLPIPVSEDAPDAHEVPAAAETTTEEYYATLESERSLPPAEIHEPLALLDRSFSLPATLPKDLHEHHAVDAIVPPKIDDHEPLSDSDTDIEDDLTPERLRQQSFANSFSGGHNSVYSVSGDDLDSPHAEPVKRLSTFEKLPAIEAPLNSIRESPNPDSRLGQPPVVKALRPPTEDEVSLVSNRVKGFIEGSSRRFQPDAPQLVITPPSGKPSMSPLPNKPSILPPSKRSPILPAARRRNGAYSSSDESSGDEQIDLDSDVEIDSDSDFEDSIPVVRPGMKLRPPPKLPAKLRDIQPVEQPA